MQLKTPDIIHRGGCGEQGFIVLPLARMNLQSLRSFLFCGKLDGKNRVRRKKETSAAIAGSFWRAEGLHRAFKGKNRVRRKKETSAAIAGSFWRAEGLRRAFKGKNRVRRKKETSAAIAGSFWRAEGLHRAFKGKNRKRNERSDCRFILAS